MEVAKLHGNKAFWGLLFRRSRFYKTAPSDCNSQVVKDEQGLEGQMQEWKHLPGCLPLCRGDAGAGSWWGCCAALILTACNGITPPSFPEMCLPGSPAMRSAGKLLSSLLARENPPWTGEGGRRSLHGTEAVSEGFSLLSRLGRAACRYLQATVSIHPALGRYHNVNDTTPF